MSYVYLTDISAAPTHVIKPSSPPTLVSYQRRILHRVQRESWVGSHVVHLGDNNVPNALTFIGECVREEK